MTIWIPDVDKSAGPIYLAIADAIGEAIGSGKLEAGSRLPPQRELAYQLGVTLSTVTRAYAEAERRKLVHGETGRGTFVSASEEKASPLIPVHEETSGYDLARNFAYPFLNPKLGADLHKLADEADELGLNTYTPSQGLIRHREAGAQFFREYYNTDIHSDQVLVCCGAQHGIFVVLQALFTPGDVLAVDELTYPSLLSTAVQMGLKPVPVPMKRDVEGAFLGMDPDALDEICSRQKVRGVFLMPNVQNPTTHTMEPEERSEIAQVAEKHGLIILEDDPYTPFVEERGCSFSSLAPEQTVSLATPAKAMAPGLRTGFIGAPAHMVSSLRETIGASIWMTPPLTAELAARWIGRGQVESALVVKKEANTRRFSLVKDVFGDMHVQGGPEKVFVWVHLPESVNSGALESELARSKVDILGAHHFQLQKHQKHAGLRLALGTVASEQKFEFAVRTVKEAVERTLNGAGSVSSEMLG